MRYRCTNPASDAWHNYGGRGITVCLQWLESYDQFVKDMGLRPDGMTLERLNTNGNYEPSNCVWASVRDNLNNRRNTIKVNGVPVTVVAEITGIKPETLRKRLMRGTSPDRILKPRLNDAKPAEHGTRSRYERDGCRCDQCRAFNAERARAFRASQRSGDPMPQGVLGSQAQPSIPAQSQSHARRDPPVVCRGQEVGT